MTLQLNIDKKTMAIGFFSLTAVGLMLANFASPPKAQAAQTVKGDQYTATTARVSTGGEALYLTNRDGVMAVFVYDPTTKRLEFRAGGSLLDSFNPPAAVNPRTPKRPGLHP